MSKKTKKSQMFSVGRLRIRRSIALVIICGLVVAFTAPFVYADQFDQQIKQLQNQNAQAQSLVNSLQSQASSYQDAINQLQTQINALQAQINDNLAKQAQLQQQIADAQNKLDHEKQILATTVKAIYVGGQLTTVEQLASSNSLSDFVDAQTYRSAVQNRIQATLTQITQLQNQLKSDKQQVDLLLEDQQAQQAQVASAQAQQVQLLSYNQAQQNQYDQQIQANQSQIASLRAQQLAANRRLVGSGGVSILSSGSCGGSYPGDAVSNYGHWGCSYGLDNGVDSWGMYNRECVSYTAWKVFHTYGVMPAWGSVGLGNANQWPGDADAYHIPHGSTPKVGSVAIGTNSYYFGSLGHAMWVEAVSNDQSQVLVSQFNFSAPGQYSEMWINTSLINTFIYFGS